MNKKNILGKVASGLAAITLFCTENSQAAELYKPLDGFGYGPYREGQNPDWGALSN